MEKPLTVLERIERMEKSLKDVNKSFDLTLEQVRGSLHSAMEVVDALVSVFGDLKLCEDLPTKLGAKIEEKRKLRIEERVAQEDKQLATLVENGILSVTDKVVKESVVVVRVFSEDGTLAGGIPKRQVDFSQLNPQVQSALLDQEVGFVLELDSKEKLEVVEIYQINQKQPETVEAAPVETPEPVAPPKALVPEIVMEG